MPEYGNIPPEEIPPPIPGELSEEEREKLGLGVLTSRILSIVTSFFTSMFQSVWAGFTQMVKPALREIEDFFVSEHEDVLYATTEAVVKFIAEATETDEETIQKIFTIKGAPKLVQLPISLIILISTITNWIGQVSQVINTPALRDLASKVHPNLPEVSALLQVAFVAPEKTKEVRDKLKKSGYSDEDINLLFLSRYRLYEEDTIRNLYLRGVLNKDQMFMRMRELGYTDTRIKEIVQGWPLIPGPADLFTLVAHEAFEPDMYTKLGLNQEFPEDQVKWLKKQGISEDWAHRYWISHWMEPSIEEGFEMFHRRDPDHPDRTIISAEEMDLIFRTIEVPPFWRDKYMKIAYTPYNRVDVRRMYDLGVISDEDLVWAYRDLGFDEEHATKMAEFTKAYSSAHNKELTQSQIMEGYKDKIITRDEAIELLKHLKWSEDQAEYLVTFEDYKEEKRRRDEIIKIIKTRYQNNLISDFEASGKLDELNIPAAKRDLLLEEWRLDKAVDVKLASKSDLAKMLKQGIINSDEYRQEMRKLGYGWKYISWYEKLARKTGK